MSGQTKHRSAEFEALAAPSTGSAARVAARLRSGAGKHADRRTRRARTRSAQQARAIEQGR